MGTAITPHLRHGHIENLNVGQDVDDVLYSAPLNPSLRPRLMQCRRPLSTCGPAIVRREASPTPVLVPIFCPVVVVVVVVVFFVVLLWLLCVPVAVAVAFAVAVVVAVAAVAVVCGVVVVVVVAVVSEAD